MDKENQQLLLSDFDYDLPKELIAQTPLLKRDESKLLVVNRENHTLTDKKFYEIIDIFKPGDVIVRNNSIVIPARLFGYKSDTKANIELLLLKQLEGDVWECLIKGADVSNLSINRSIGITIHFFNSKVLLINGICIGGMISCF